MSKSQPQTTDKIDSQCLIPVVVTTPIMNGVIGGISSVITAYFFKPVWSKITKIWEKKETL